jgi:hypothetical protein
MRIRYREIPKTEGGRKGRMVGVIKKKEKK